MRHYCRFAARHILQDMNMGLMTTEYNEVTAKRLIDEQPTIDAIPVEWLRAFCVDDIADDQRETIEWMLKVWKREQEAR